MSEQTPTNNPVGKRKKTNRACNHCHKAHMPCTNSRPCLRCIQRGLQDTCEDAPRKRKKYLADVPTQDLAPRNSNGGSGAGMGISPPNSYQSTPFQHSATAPINNYEFNNPATNLTRTATQSLIKEEPNLSFYSSNDKLFNLNEFGTNDQRTKEFNFPNQQQPQPTYRKRTNFLSSAADLEYSTLSNILQDNFMHINHPSSTSAEGTPNSINLSPALSPHNFANQGLTATTPSTSNIRGIGSPQSQSQSQNHPQNQSLQQRHFHNSKNLSPYVSGPSQSPSPQHNGRKSNDYYNSSFPKCDESINQYFLGLTGSDNLTVFPDIIMAIESMKESDPSVYHERNSKLVLSFAIGIVPDDNYGELDLHFKEPEEIYAKVTKPFSYTPGYHSLIAYLRKRFPKEMLVKMAESMAAYRPSFIACTNSLKEGDLIFMEQCFQRTLLTYDNFIKVSGTPTIVWRRTGEIAYVGNEFSILTGWTKEELITKKKTFIVELLDDKSVVEYFQLFLRIAFGDFLGATMTECSLLTPKEGVKIRTGCMWTLKRDVFGIPMMIIGNFLPIV
ncbi:hypothetical protein HYPBUDRAFT_153237 [Hyphopichia burtonii NRRL Y-1933]|uniref:Transcription activator of gluconeogenesis ERT1 n=1 Tax=Hyphopichia burtonii NRRL Y-1933 TaxID=984485 RepID=A0A1E4RGD9_9ASCO|nr:hypothetical protein HYPBUDRAFT_153237 [Hyphopichia burtonii NRRL Y-1933]ODV66337.1 hypothetical protein HYPBUDRAFT_153237 [Hyphopichia burtonii NRRL Y-1933]